MRLGNLEARLLLAGLYRLDGGAMFGVVPKALWERKRPADARNRIAMCTNLLLVSGNGAHVLIDTGNGAKGSPKFDEIYAIDHAAHDLDRALAASGVSRADITHVVNTHLHFDHAGGNTALDPGGRAVPAFPNARYLVQRRQFEQALDPSARDAASYLPENYLPVRDAGQLHLLDGDAEILPGISCVLAEGHTVGHMAVLVRGGRETLFFPSDMVPMSHHVPERWVMGYDLHPTVTLDEKRTWLKRAVDGNWIVAFVHDPEVRAARIGRDGKDFFVKEPVALNP